MPASIKLVKLIMKTNNKGASLLARWPADRLFYMVKPTKVNEEKKRAMVVFEDNTECWVNVKDLQIQFDQIPEDDLIICCVCDSGESDQPNVLIICDTCQQAYHQKCHEPQLSDKVSEDDIEWNCNTCQLILKQTDSIKKPKVINTSKNINNNTTTKKINTTITKSTKDKSKPIAVADKQPKQPIKSKLPKMSAKRAKSKENSTPPPTSDEMMDIVTAEDEAEQKK